VFFAQGREFSGQNPDEFNAVLRRPGNKVVVPFVRHSKYGCVLPVHNFNIPFLPRKSNQVVTPNVRHEARWIFAVALNAIGAESVSVTRFEIKSESLPTGKRARLLIKRKKENKFSLRENFTLVSGRPYKC